MEITEDKILDAAESPEAGEKWLHSIKNIETCEHVNKATLYLEKGGIINTAINALLENGMAVTAVDNPVDKEHTEIGVSKVETETVEKTVLKPQ